jgi:hypothetical protein
MPMRSGSTVSTWLGGCAEPATAVSTMAARKRTSMPVEAHIQ